MLSQKKHKLRETNLCTISVKYLVLVSIHPSPARRVEAGKKWKF